MTHSFSDRALWRNCNYFKPVAFCAYPNDLPARRFLQIRCAREIRTSVETRPRREDKAVNTIPLRSRLIDNARRARGRGEGRLAIEKNMSVRKRGASARGERKVAERAQLIELPTKSSTVIDKSSRGWKQGDAEVSALLFLVSMQIARETFSLNCHAVIICAFRSVCTLDVCYFMTRPRRPF